jgi:hypothetical protein
MPRGREPTPEEIAQMAHRLRRSWPLKALMATVIIGGGTWAGFVVQGWVMQRERTKVTREAAAILDREEAEERAAALQPSHAPSRQ